MMQFNSKERLLTEEEELNLKKAIEKEGLALVLDLDCFKGMGSYVLPVRFDIMASRLFIFEVKGMIIHYIESLTNRRFCSYHLDESNRVLLLVFC